MLMAKKVKEEKVQVKTLEQLKEERDALKTYIEEILVVCGAETSMLEMIIEDLKSQMVSHASAEINDKIADLINLENKIARLEEEERELNSQRERELYW